MKLYEIYESILTENVKQADQLLVNIGYDINDTGYKEFKSKVVSSNSVGYLVPIIKLSTKNGKFNIDDANDAYSFIKANRDLMKSIDISKYDSFEELKTAVDNMHKSRVLKKFAKLIPFKDMAESFINMDVDDEVINNLELFFSFSDDDQRGFISKISRYKSVDALYSALLSHIENVTLFNYDDIMSSVKDLGNEVDVVYDNQDKLLLRVHTYNAMKTLGTETWCIVGDERHWEGYTGGDWSTTANQYFYIDFRESVDPENKMIAFTTKPSNPTAVSAAFDRYDTSIDDVNRVISKLGISKMLRVVNDSSAIISRKSGQFEFDANEQKAALKGLIRDIILSLESGGQYLDKILQKHSATKIVDVKTDRDSHGYSVTDSKEMTEEKFDVVDVLCDLMISDPAKVKSLIQSVTRDGLGGEIKTFNEIIAAFKKTATRNISPNNKRSILRLLKHYDYDILGMERNTKLKHGVELTPNEFGALVKRGDDMRPYIQNKVAKWRKGEASFSDTELSYMIDNGYGALIKKKYLEMLKDVWSLNIEYEDINIMMKLGMGAEAYKAVKAKEDVVGRDGLNSIETSILNTHRG